MAKVILHQWEMSPFCNKVRRCLRYKGIEYTVVDYNGLLARKAAALSPAGQLPVLDWDGQSLYFYEIYFRMLDPVSLERGLDLICKGRPGWERAVLKFVFKRRYPQKLGWQGLGRQPREEVERRFFGLLGDLDAVLATRPWLAGEGGLSIADISVVAQIDELVRTSDLAPQVLALRHLKGWYERCNQLAPAR